MEYIIGIIMIILATAYFLRIIKKQEKTIKEFYLKERKKEKEREKEAEHFLKMLDEKDSQIANLILKEEQIENIEDKAKKDLNQILEEYKEMNIQRIDAIIDKHFEELYDIKSEFYLESSFQLESEWDERQKEFTEYKEEVADYKSFIESINQAILREREIEEEKTFYLINIEEDDLDDIKVLREVAPKIKRPEILNKLIFETYYRRPMREMFNRVTHGKKPCGVYKITNSITKEIYIGKSVEITPRRWTDHIKNGLDIGNIAVSPLHLSMKKYGVENFIFEVVEECAREKLTEKEKKWIGFYQSDIYGLNAKRG